MGVSPMRHTGKMPVPHLLKNVESENYQEEF